jgi:outer membrane protein assembly factor BamD (BamD/ComL family)
MSRWPIALFLLATSVSAQQTTPPKPAAEKKEDVQLPPEEDKTDAPKVYSFNPLQSKKEVSVGEFYAKKSDNRAAAIRFREATKWDDSNAEAWLRLAETEEKNHDTQAAREAYEKYLQLSPTAKNAGDVKKRIEKLASR